MCTMAGLVGPQELFSSTYRKLERSFPLVVSNFLLYHWIHVRSYQRCVCQLVRHYISSKICTRKSYSCTRTQVTTSRNSQCGPCHAATRCPRSCHIAEQANSCQTAFLATASHHLPMSWCAQHQHSATMCMVCAVRAVHVARAARAH